MICLPTVYITRKKSPQLFVQSLKASNDASHQRCHVVLIAGIDIRLGCDDYDNVIFSKPKRIWYYPLVNQHSNGISPFSIGYIHLQRVHFHCHVSSPVCRISFLMFPPFPWQTSRPFCNILYVNQSKSKYQVLDFGLSGKKKMVPHLNGRQKTSSLQHYWSWWCDFRDLQISGIPRVPWTDVRSVCVCVCHKPAHLITSATMDDWLHINLQSSESFMNKINQSINQSIHASIHSSINHINPSPSIDMCRNKNT